MSQSQGSIPIAKLTVDIKRKRIRITAKTLKMINEPECFRILVNPASKGLVIEGCLESDKGAYLVSKMPFHKGSYELTSTSLIKEIVCCAGFIGTETVRLSGIKLKDQEALFFRLEQCRDCDPAPKAENEVAYG